MHISSFLRNTIIRPAVDCVDETRDEEPLKGKRAFDADESPRCLRLMVSLLPIEE